MEEDIKILEKIIHLFKSNDTKCLSGLDIRALENLIKGYRELEEKLNSSRKANELLNKTNNELRWEIRTTYSKVVNDIISKFNLGDDYIPKSKIRDKIEKLEREFDFYAGRCHHEWQDGEFDGEVCDEIATKISTLKKLLEEEPWKKI